MLVVTNNPIVIQELGERAQVVEGDVTAVLEHAWKEVRSGRWRLAGSPLPPNRRLMESPYRSVVLEAAGRSGLDRRGLEALRKAMAAQEKLPHKVLPEDAPGEFARMDREFLKSFF
ncbi:MAG: GrdX family protein [Synergistales bacterium]|nr:GrdX family protein [Synergistales bacterium]